MEHTIENPLMNKGQGGGRNRDGKPQGRVYLRELAINSQGYDREGHYWGNPSRSVGTVWVATAGPGFRRFVWGHHLEDAQRKLGLDSKNLHPRSQRRIDAQVKKRLGF